MSQVKLQLRATLSLLGSRDVALQSQMGLAAIINSLDPSHLEDAMSEILAISCCNVLAKKGRLR